MTVKWMDQIERLGGDGSDPAWSWFLHTGPHGPYFTWSQTKNEPAGYVGVEHLERLLASHEEQEPGFAEKARQVVRKAFDSTDCNLLRRAIQVGAVVGEEAELENIVRLTSHENESVVKDARAAVFYLKRRLSEKE